MLVSDFDYRLPPELIAQAPLPRRDQSRLLVLHRDGRVEHRRFSDLPEYLPGETVYLHDSPALRTGGVDPRRFPALPEYLQAETVSLNDSRVLRARVFLIRASGGRVAAL